MDIVVQNITYSKEKKEWMRYPALLKMPFRMRLCPQHISNQTDARAISTEVWFSEQYYSNVEIVYIFIVLPNVISNIMVKNQ